jgi:hypothetical protein
MKRTTVLMVLCSAVVLGAVLAAQDAGGSAGLFPVPNGPYLGQKPPGQLPQLFAPGIVSTGMDDLNAVFAADATEFFFTVKLPVRGRHVMLTMKQAGGRWSAPTVLAFSGQYNDADPALAPRLYPHAEVFDERIVSEYGGGDVFIAPDQAMIIFSSGRPGGYGNSDLYVSFRREDRSWTAPQNLGPAINSPYQEYCPSVSPDGKYFFFSSYKRPEDASVPTMRSLDDILRMYRQPYNGAGDVYWVDAAVIHALKGTSLQE